MGRRGARTRALLAALGVALVGAAAFAWIGNHEPAPLPTRDPGQRPGLMLVTTLPLIFAERFSLEGGGSKALDALERQAEVLPIGTAAAGELRQARLLLMAHPLAQPAEALVDLDAWVRRG